ncbi:unnamed protein product [Haemonchus placei]|uniref:Uncharacterized protein n=1 Tax=Haemonchus placei TaxID=6290 RepID=A0A0N4WSK5_HAEPC|nr:unnamed protein product [Haemonchus placei]
MKLRKEKTVTPADIIMARLSPTTQSALSSARATTLRTMDEEGQEERRSAAEEAKRARYVCHLPEIANPANVLDYMGGFNSRQFSVGPGYFQDEYKQQYLNLRRVAQLIQEELEEMKLKMELADRFLGGDYEVEFFAHIDEKTKNELKSYSISAHSPIYKEKSNLMALVLKHEGGRSRREQAVFVVLLGESIGPIQRKRYGNCTICDESQGSCQTRIEQTDDRKSDKSLLQMFG